MPERHGTSAREKTTPRDLLDEGLELPRHYQGVLILAVVGLAAQMLAFWYGAQAIVSTPRDPGAARTLAAIGLGGTLATCGAFAFLIREGHVDGVGALLLLTVGGGVGAFVASQIFDSSRFFSALFTYKGLALFPAPAAGVFLGALALVLRDRGRAVWKTVLASPLLLETGVHAALLLKLLTTASDLG